jgi:hypothetical protein
LTGGRYPPHPAKRSGGVDNSIVLVSIIISIIIIIIIVVIIIIIVIIVVIVSNVVMIMSWCRRHRCVILT